jgi:SAM-dependent methyltransferase
VKLRSRIVLVCMAISLSAVARTQAPAFARGGSRNAPSVAGTKPRATAQPTPITVQLVQPSAQPRNPKLEALQAYAPYIAAILALLGVLGTAIYTLYRGRMDARYAYASEVMKFRLRQIGEFYAPALTYIEQSRVLYEKLRWTLRQERKDISLEGFRLLDHIFEFDRDPKLAPLVRRILAIGTHLTTLIAQKSGLIEGGITPTFIEYQGHFEILNAAGTQQLSKEQTEGWHERGYYPRFLNREIREGYKVVLTHLQNYAYQGDKIISRLLGQKPIPIGKYRRQLIESLHFYEDHAKEYAAKFDTFDLAGVRQPFISEIEGTRTRGSQALGDGVIKILDAGCGTGRDMYDFLRKGYGVTAIDASPAMLRECRKKLNAALDTPEDAQMRRAAGNSRCLEVTFDEIEYRGEFDGVWAAASLLHIPPQRMGENLRRLVQALKPNGILYMSLKYGLGEREYDGRFYYYYSRKLIRALLKQILSAKEIQVWLSDANGRNLSQEKQRRAWMLECINSCDRSLWLNVLVRKVRLI